jgi:uncharacterized protein (TIGR03437 family)
LGEVYAPLAEAIASLGGVDGIFFNFSFAVTGGSLPPGLTLTPNGVFSGTLTTPGQFNATVTISLAIGIEGMTIFNTSSPSPVTFIVTPSSGPSAAVIPPALSFSLTQNAAGVTQSVSIANQTSQALPFSTSATTNSGGNWLRLSLSEGSVPSFGSSGLAVTADPSQLTAGTYTGTVSISISGGPTLAISVLAVVAGTQPNIQLSQTGERFLAVSGGTATSPQAITVLNPGAGTLDFTASASTLAGGDWLSISPASGTTSAAAAGSVTLSVNPDGLQPGNYYGKIQFSAPGAVNSPQVTSVVLNVLSPANSPGAFVQPSGLIFVGTAGGSDPAAQSLSITNPSPNALTFLTTVFADSPSSGMSTWATATPSNGSVSATQAATVSVQPSLQGLMPGTYIGDLALTFVAPGAASSTSSAAPQVLHVELLLVVLPAGSSPASRAAPNPHALTTQALTTHALTSRDREGAVPGLFHQPVWPQASGCTPTQLLPVFTLLGGGFTASAGWPTAIEVTVVDDCGNPLDTGSVTVTFSSGDPPLALQSLHDGHWTATWNATHVSSTVTITAQAQEVMPALTGMASIGGTLQPNAAAPAVSTGGVVSAANFAQHQPLAPGAFAAIFGSNLSQGLIGSNQLPLSLQLGGTSVLLAGEALPLLFASGAQVNVVVPYNVPVNSTQQLIVQQGTAISMPQSVVIAPAQPAVFTQNGVGTGAALINLYKADGTPLPDNSPVTGGDVMVIYCTGLGAVNPTVAAGSQTPAAPLSYAVNPVTVTIGQMQGKVLFAGLTPLYAQLYQVNVEIPSGLPSGTAVLTVSAGGQTSAPVSVTVQ